MRKIIKIFGIFTILIISFNVKVHATELNEFINEEEILTQAEIIEVMSKVQELKINASAALLYDKTYDKILYEKNIDAKLPNASTTKVLTAIVAYENSSMDEVVEISERAASIGGSTINLRKGNKVLMGDLMKGLLMSSGNDAAIAIAEHVGGSVENFCEMMNQRAKELGATNTNFVTPHGLDRDDHYTTIQDLLIFTKYFMGIPYLLEISNTSTASIKIDNYTKELRTTNEMLAIYDAVNGIKTGFTGKAGRCLITSISSGERELITMVLGCDTKKQRTTETIQLIAYGYKEFEEIDIFENMKKSFEIRVKKSLNDKYEVKIGGNKKVLVRKGDANAIEYNYEILHDLVAPLQKGEKIGQIQVALNDEILTEISITIPYEINRKNFMQYFNEIIQKQKMYTEVKT
ncbi:MAG: D-alanyl-D-alanine carboxypeptidase [Clostridia bacterium]|nr:D-alanyl-D-alanine carboxypeptidase [Clostridia bacterium]